jgi:hypothetical protein
MAVPERGPRRSNEAGVSVTRVAGALLRFWIKGLMRNVTQRALRAILVSVMISAGGGAAVAQSGSAGGSIGNDEKSLSGSREAPHAVESDRPAPRGKPDSEESGRPSRKSGGEGGGGGGSFDGAWVVVSVGTTCSGGSTSAVVVSSGKIIGKGVSGRVSPNGAVNAVGNSNGVTVISTGRISSRSGSGSFRQSDGCIGRWTASKQ